MTTGQAPGRAFSAHPAGASDAAVPSDWLTALRRYLVAMALGNLAWEFAHMPLYTLWAEGDWGDIVFAAVHCTGGDVLIGLSALAAALVLMGRADWPARRFGTVAAVTVAIGLTYTAFSEWLNVVRRAAWAYSDAMPVVPLGGFDIGLSPLAQWVIVPALALWQARRPAAGRLGRATA